MFSKPIRNADEFDDHLRIRANSIGVFYGEAAELRFLRLFSGGGKMIDFDASYMDYMYDSFKRRRRAIPRVLKKARTNKEDPSNLKHLIGSYEYHENEDILREILREIKDKEKRAECAEKLLEFTKAPYDLYLLGKCHFDRKDYDKAIPLLERGMPDSSSLLGKCAELGLGMEKNLNKALSYYRIAVYYLLPNSMEGLRDFIQRHDIKDGLSEALLSHEFSIRDVLREARRCFLENHFIEDGLYMFTYKHVIKDLTYTKEEICREAFRILDIPVYKHLAIPGESLDKLVFLFDLADEKKTELPYLFTYYGISGDYARFYQNKDKETPHTPSEASLYFGITRTEALMQYEMLSMFLYDFGNLKKMDYLIYMLRYDTDLKMDYHLFSRNLWGIPWKRAWEY